MNEQETTEDIIAEARDKYTVHECNQCAWRKCCSEGFGSEKCGKFRESIFLKLGIEDGYFTQLLDRLEAAHRRDRGNAAKLRNALVAIKALTELHADERSELGTVYRTAKAFLREEIENA